MTPPGADRSPTPAPGPRTGRRRGPPRALVLVPVLVAAGLAWLAVRDDAGAGPPPSGPGAPALRPDPPPGAQAPRPRGPAPAPAAGPLAGADAHRPGGGRPARAPDVWVDPGEPGAHVVLDDAGPLRPVRGLVVEAGTRRPVAGAWVAWRPPPPRLADEVLAAHARGELEGALDEGPGILTDAEGRFEVERLPDDELPHDTVFAVHPALGMGSTPAGLEPEVVIELAPPCELAVDVVGHPSWGALDPDRRQLEVEVQPEALAEVVAGQSTLATWREVIDAAAGATLHLRGLPPGSCRIALAGRPVGDVTLQPGAAARARVVVPPLARLRLGLRGLAGRSCAVQLTSVADGLLAKVHAFELFAPGVHDAYDAPAGAYELTAHVDGTSLALGRFELAPGEQRLDLELPGLSPLEVRLTGHTSTGLDERLALRAWPGDGAGHDALPGAQRDRPGVYVAAAPPGRYVLSLDRVPLRTVEVPGPPVEVALAWTRLTVVVALPDDLLPDERIRVLAACAWAEAPGAPLLDVERPHRVGRDAPSFDLHLPRPGRYRLEGASDLGGFAAEVTVPPEGARVEVTPRPRASSR